jgi:membrane protease YdiL (CAAX protease family)
MPVLTFLSVTFVVTWIAWLSADALSPGEAARGASGVLFYLGVFAPGIVALVLTWRAEGGSAVAALLGRLFQWQVGLRWYAFALGYMAAVKLAAAVLHRLVGGAWPRFGEQPVILMILAAVFSTVTLGQAGEELGWRGYALPRLAERFGMGLASVLLGVIWAVWHLPLFFIAETGTTDQSFPIYLLQVTAVSVAIAWVFHNTGGSLLLAMLLHAAINNTKDIVPSAPATPPGVWTLSGTLVSWLTVVLLWLGAAYFLVRMGRSQSSRSLAPSPFL